MVKSYWLMKSEPDVWSIDQQIKAGNKGAPWDGVRNYQDQKTFSPCFTPPTKGYACKSK